MLRRPLALVLLTVLACAAPVAVGAQKRSPMFRVFLIDGRSLTSFGEWARLDDRVAFSMPLSEGDTPDLQLVTVPARRIDWPRTERYAATVRAVHYTSTRAEDDFAVFSSQVAEVLTGIAREPDPKRRLAIAEAARGALAGWPQQHHGYRAADVQQMLTLLDEVVSELRAKAGQDTFELDLVSTTPAPSAVSLLPSPSTAQLAEELVAAASVVDGPAERTTLLERVVDFIDRAAGLLPASWATSVRTTALQTIATDQAVDAAYAQMATAVLNEASTHAKTANVRALEGLRARVMKGDRELGSQRPVELAAVLSVVGDAADAARRLRLSLDQRRLLEPQYARYRRAMAPALREFTRVTPGLADIRAQAGPAPAALRRALRRFNTARPAMMGTTPPTPLTAAHALLRSAWDLANTALKMRMEAVEFGDETRAGEASAAAAGALLMIARAREDLDAALKLPSLR